jgi:hypothetical protein
MLLGILMLSIVILIALGGGAAHVGVGPVLAALSLIQIGVVLGMLGMIGDLAGAGFCLFAPTRKGALGLMIGAATVAALNLILAIPFLVVPLFSHSMSSSPFFLWTGGFGIVCDMLMIAEVMLVGLFLGAVSEGRIRVRALTALCIVTAITDLLLSIILIALIPAEILMAGPFGLDSSETSARRIGAFLRIALGILWFANVIWIATVTYYLKKLWHSWKTI